MADYDFSTPVAVGEDAVFYTGVEPTSSNVEDVVFYNSFEPTSAIVELAEAGSGGSSGSGVLHRTIPALVRGAP